MISTFYARAARQWMVDNVAEHVDPKTGEVDATGLAEACAHAFEADEVGGALDDPDHWIRDYAAEVAEEHAP